MIADLVERLRPKLPLQNPLHSFVHNNILMMFEDLEFHEAMKQASKLYRANCYQDLDFYRAQYKGNKISDEDIHQAIDNFLVISENDELFSSLKLAPKEILYRLMHNDFSMEPEEEISFQMDEEIWQACLRKAENVELNLSTHIKWRGKDYWEKFYNESYQLNYEPLMIKLISSYLDQGQSFWKNPYTSLGFYSFFKEDLIAQNKFCEGWVLELSNLVIGYKDHNPAEIIQLELLRKGIPQDLWEGFLTDLLFDLKGWSGMVNKLETEPFQAPVKAPHIKLIDYLAGLVLMDSAMDLYHAGKASLDLKMIIGRTEKIVFSGIGLGALMYRVLKLLNLSEKKIQELSPQQLIHFLQTLNSYLNNDIKRLWHEAYENQYHSQAMRIVLNNTTHVKKPSKAYAQVLFCIDDREESLRRHLEEADPEVETFGVVGFFNIDMIFSSFKNNRLVPQCPPVIKPTRIIYETPLDYGIKFHHRHWFWGVLDLNLYYQSRTLFRGFLSTIILGPLSMIPMFLQVFFPHLAKMLREKIHHRFTHESLTMLEVNAAGEGIGYSKEEQASIVESVLKICGIENRLSDLIIILGHGSSSTNNPFRQAYGCGACGGHSGVPNARAFVKMSNDPEVRKILTSKNVKISESTFFLSAHHDTSTDRVTFYNENELPEHLKHQFDQLSKNLLNALKKNSFERSHKFSSFDSFKGPEGAHQHVLQRADDMAQPRPEYGHSLNALAIVGPRSLTKGLYLNRRSFLLSYDWTNDSDGELLKQVVVGGIPVAVNINMDYYFSSVDNENFGCGSKLPLNLTSLLGVMTGSSSDLRIGLARQMIEIHEPIRNLTFIQAPLERVKHLFLEHKRLNKLLTNHWFKLVVIDPEIQKNYIYHHQEFREYFFNPMELQQFSSSMDLIKHEFEGQFAKIII